MATQSERVRLTPERIRKAEPATTQQYFLRDTEVPGLAVRVTASGQKAFIIERKLSGRTVRMTLGSTDALLLGDARKDAAAKLAAMRDGRDPRVMKAEALAADTLKREQARKVREAEREATQRTFERLLMAYADHLKEKGRQSHGDVRSIFTLHVVEAWPKLAYTPAAAITSENIADMMRRLQEAGKGRTANKLRSYIHAAFEVARTARFDASVPVSFKTYGIVVNPAGETLADASKNKADKNPLTESDLVEYWRIIKDAPGLPGAVLRLHLLTGGQRLAQLVRLLADDVSGDTITLYDGKGRPGTDPRPHLVPLIPEAAKALEAAKSGAQYMLSTDGGETHLSASTLSKWAKEAVGDQIPGFTLKRVRSGVETLLSRRKVGKDIRGRLQSHGIAGIQDRHYDAHDYLPEKRRALMTLYNALERRKASVTAIRDKVA